MRFVTFSELIRDLVEITSNLLFWILPWAILLASVIEAELVEAYENIANEEKRQEGTLNASIVN